MRPSRETLLHILAEAQLAPSVHNVQPARWRLNDDGLLLLGDTRRTIPIADPSGRDWRLSLGAQLEGFAIAAARHEVRLAGVTPVAAAAIGRDGLEAIARVGLDSGGGETVPPQTVSGRATWRGDFAEIDTAANEAVTRLSSLRRDCVVVASRPAISAIARLFDTASMHFLRQTDHRAELLHWMRLSRRHPSYATDGLNAEAMAMAPLEAWAARLVLGPLFRTLDSIGLAALLTSEAGKTRSAAAIVLFHRPDLEDAFETGRHFYRAWLDIERAGLKACPMSVLADWDVSRTQLLRDHAIPAGRRIIGVFRVGVPKGSPVIRRFRLPVESLLV
ncbi:MAG: hypothetical protein KF914_01670 [Rhizobiaceae bacterium]|nr:hypothetical protein [Rhizobiaceae bacterium]